MKNKVLYKLILLILALISLSAVFAACSGNIAEAALYSIKILENNEYRVRYNVGEELDADGLFLRCTYSDGSTKNIAVTIDMVTVPDMETLGPQKVNVKYLGKKTSYTVMIGHFETVTVKFYADGSYWGKKTTIKGERLYNPPVPPEKTGYNQIEPGWSLTEGGEKITLPGRKFDEDGELFSVYTINRYTVTFTADGGTLAVVSDITHGSAIDPKYIPEIPQKQHYDRKNWDKNPVNLIITDHTVINVQYYANVYEVKFDLKGGNPAGDYNNYPYSSENGIITQKVTYDPGGSNNKATAPSVWRAGYIFLNWLGSFEKVESNITINANWAANTDTEYKTEYYFQDINGNYIKDGYKPSGWAASAGWTKVDKGTTDTLSPVFDPPATITGNITEQYRFNPGLSNTRTQIYGDGSGVCKIYYDYLLRRLTVINSNNKAGSVTGAGCSEQGPAAGGMLYLYEANLTVTATEYAGYTFTGWYEGNKLIEAGREINFNLNPPRNRTLTAKWAANIDTLYSVEYYFQDINNENNYTVDNSLTQYLRGTTDTSCSATASAIAGFTYNPVLTATNGNTVNGNTVSGNIDGDGSRILKIYYTRNSYSLIFDGNGGDLKAGTGNETQSVKYQGVVTAPVYNKEGYMFAAWWRVDPVSGARLEKLTDYERSPDGIFTYTMPANSVTIQIEWRIGIFRIDFKNENFKAGSIMVNGINYTYTGSSLYHSGMYGYGQVINFQPVINPGYSFSGWYINGAKVSNPDNFPVPGNDVTIEARFTANSNTEYTVRHWTQNIEDDGYTLRTSAKLYGTTDTLADASSQIQSIPGFYRDTAKGSLTGNIEGDKSLVLTIYYNRNIYTVNFVLNGGIINNGASVSADLKYGASFTDMPGVIMPRFAAREGHVFDDDNDWLDQDNVKFTASTAVSKNLTVTARWTVLQFDFEVKNEETVPNSGNITSSHASGKQYYGTIITLTAEPMAGYDFAGWYEGGQLVNLGALSGNIYTYILTVPARNISLEARWTPRTDTRYTLILKLENINDDGFTQYGSAVILYGTSDAEVTYSDILAAVSAHMSGVSYVWPEAGNEFGVILGDGSLVVNIEFLRPRYTVTFNGNGATTQNGRTTQTVKEGGTAEAVVYTKLGHTFTGWDIPLWPITANTTVSAQWAVKSYNLTVINGDGEKGSVSGSPDGIYDFNSVIILTATAAGTNIFDGWYDSSGKLLSRDETYIFNMPYFNLEITARWVV